MIALAAVSGNKLCGATAVGSAATEREFTDDDLIMPQHAVCRMIMRVAGFDTVFQ